MQDRIEGRAVIFYRGSTALPHGIFSKSPPFDPSSTLGLEDNKNNYEIYIQENVSKNYYSVMTSSILKIKYFRKHSFYYEKA